MNSLDDAAVYFRLHWFTATRHLPRGSSVTPFARLRILRDVGLSCDIVVRLTAAFVSWSRGCT